MFTEVMVGSMDNRIVRILLAVLAAALLVGVLSVLIVESRAVKEDYYIAHAERMRAIESSRSDIAAIQEGTKIALEDGRAIPDSVDLAFMRLADNNAALQLVPEAAPEESTTRVELTAYDASLNRFVSDGKAFAARQNAFAGGLKDLQEESPLVVKDLRRFNLRIQSQNAFSLAIDVIEFATGQSGGNADALTGRIETLRNDATMNLKAPGLADKFLSAADNVISERIAAENALERISNSSISDSLWATSNAILEDNRRIVSRAERARLLLSVCAVLLLVGTGFAMVRLQTSYRDLNRSNAQLEVVNDSLEERVGERTEELSEAYDELKESQVQLVQAEKMSSLGELVAGISHEINTPLWYLMNNSTVVQERLDTLGEFCGIAENMIETVATRHGVKEAVTRGLVDMKTMLNDGLKEDIEEAKDLINDCIEGLEELTELAQSLKDFSRLDRSKQGEFNVNDGLDKTLLIAKNRLKNKVEIHKHYGEVPSIHCSPSQINQIFLNLITNAADAIPDSGEILLKTWVEGENVCVGVSDTGTGIPDEVIAKIRDPFFTTKEVGKGTGLGLSIVDQIVTAHGGELKIDSEVGKGTAVTVVLPLTIPELHDVVDEGSAAAAAQIATDVSSANDDATVESEADPQTSTAQAS